VARRGGSIEGEKEPEEKGEGFGVILLLSRIKPGARKLGYRGWGGGEFKRFSKLEGHSINF